MLHVFLAAAILAGHPAAHNASPCVTRTFNYSITQGSPILGPFYGRAYYAAFPSWGYGWTSYCGTGYWGGFTVPAVYGPIVWGLPYHPIYSNHPYWGPVPVRVQTYRFSGSPRPHGEATSEATAAASVPAEAKQQAPIGATGGGAGIF